MEHNAPIPGWNAHRHASSPIAQPKYRFQDVPKCEKNLKGSVIQEVTGRQAFKEIMGEMVLLCNEAMKRNRAGRTASKPLSLEYIADRLDVDDPCFGYIVRSKAGQLQGFITVTTFTNWQKNFKWDSMHEVAFYYDNEDHGDSPRSPSPRKPNGTGTPRRKRNASPRTPTPMKRPRKRVVDEDGSLAKELQKTVRLGDPYNEGIVWPRIAEISLLGALGCGKALVQLVIEHLEFQRASGSANYDYLAQQATDNSIPFYESRGFVRVGAVTYESRDPHSRSVSPAFSTSTTASEWSSAASSVAVEAVELPPGSPEKPEAIAVPKTIVSSPHFVYTVTGPAWTPNEISRKFKVSVWDVIFLNKDLYVDLKPTSRLKRGTLLHVPELPADEEDPVQSSASGGTKSPGSPTKWFVAKENDTPRKIAKQFGLACNNLVSANRRLLPELQATSRLRAGTRLKVSNLDKIDEICEQYCHWSFPEDTAVEGGDPSYMMVFKLDRKTARNPRTVRNSFAVPVTQHTPPKLLFPPPSKTDPTAVVPKTKGGRQVPVRRKPAVPAPKLPPQPRRPAELTKPSPGDGKDIYREHQKELHPEYVMGTPETEKAIHDRWSRLGAFKKDKYHAIAAEARKIYQKQETEYLSQVAQWRKACKKIQEEHSEEIRQKQAEAESKLTFDKHATLYNKVVKLREDALEGKEFKYWYVLTYIPDLKWCYLVPIFQDGHYGPERKRAYGRPRYRLVQKQGIELDISSSYCIPVTAKALRGTVDADNEEWDIHDGPVQLVKTVSDTESMDLTTTSAKPASTKKRLSKAPKFRSAIKPIEGKIEIGSTVRQDPLKRTRSSPVVSAASRKRSLDEAMFSDVATTPMKERNRRRCMRCVENGASYGQAVTCLGAKGRFGRDACENYEANGAPKREAVASPGSGRKPRRCTRCIEFGAPDDQASQCRGAKGRFGKEGCLFFTASGEPLKADDDSIAEPPLKKQRKVKSPKVVSRKSANAKVAVAMSKKERNSKPPRRPDASPSRSRSRWTPSSGKKLRARG
ncbi:MAG: hypothetical protein SGILL_005644 [Bacillariaceae sp.]